MQAPSHLDTKSSASRISELETEIIRLRDENAILRERISELTQLVDGEEESWAKYIDKKRAAEASRRSVQEFQEKLAEYNRMHHK